MEIYKFTPLVKRTIWGGDRIAKLKHIESTLDNVGETWEISGLDGNETAVCGGAYDGMPVNDLIRAKKEQLMGRDNYRKYGNEFPLLVKFIDAKRDLSIQVHPDDVTARRHGQRRGKTEMWYVMHSAPGATLFAGLRQWITPRQYEVMVNNHTITEALARYNVSEGDVFYIPAGRIHSIGAGCMIAEIQRTCDLTYRIYDFNRRDAKGNLRPLHTRLASESINYRVIADYRTHYHLVKNARTQLIRCPFFTTSVYDIDARIAIDYSHTDTFVILLCLEGASTLGDGRGEQVEFNAGDTLLLPATAKEITIRGRVKFLESYI